MPLTEAEKQLLEDLKNPEKNRHVVFFNLIKYLEDNSKAMIDSEFLKDPKIRELSKVTRKNESFQSREEKYLYFLILLNQHEKGMIGHGIVNNAISILFPDPPDPNWILPRLFLKQEFKDRLKELDNKIVVLLDERVNLHIDADNKMKVETLEKIATDDLAEIEKATITLQRIIRKKIRKKEDLARWTVRYRMGKADALKHLNFANKPYLPNCKKYPNLSGKIVTAALKVSLFNEVSHHTTSAALTSIMNDGLYGRRSLGQHKMDYTPAAYDEAIDNLYGDENVICMGAFGIDTIDKQDIKMVLDSQYISRINPCLFFKQRDLGYELKKKRPLDIGQMHLEFDHTTTKYINNQANYFTLYEGGKEVAESDIKKDLLISQNSQEMDAILILNFFRFIDALKKKDGGRDYADEIYSALNKLSDEELLQTLTEIGKNISDTMEFNFYGAYKINFDALKKIENKKTGYTLVLNDFLQELNKGKVEALTEANKQLPNVFKSYRFMDYLISRVNNDEILNELHVLRDKCETPSYIKPK